MLDKCARLHQVVTTPRPEQDGATAVEYGLMVAFIALAIIASVLALGGKLTDFFNTVAGLV